MKRLRRYLSIAFNVLGFVTLAALAFVLPRVLPEMPEAKGLSGAITAVVLCHLVTLFIPNIPIKEVFPEALLLKLRLYHAGALVVVSIWIISLDFSSFFKGFLGTLFAIFAYLLLMLLKIAQNSMEGEEA